MKIVNYKQILGIAGLGILSILVLTVYHFRPTLDYSKSGASEGLPVGHLDIANCTELQGWTLDPDHPSDPIFVQLWDGPAGDPKAKVFYSEKTNFYRSDVNKAGDMTKHGFKIPTPEVLKDGEHHTIYAYGIDVDDSRLSTVLIGSPIQSRICEAILPPPAAQCSHPAPPKGCHYERDATSSDVCAVKLLPVGCNQPGVNLAPTITDFNPKSGPVGTTVIIQGNNFDHTTRVKFNGALEFTPSIKDGVVIALTVPVGATTGPISVTQGGITVIGATFTLTDIPKAPMIDDPNQGFGLVGTKILINGTNLDNAQVRFNGILANNVVIYPLYFNFDMQISVIVPVGATTGKITVTTPGGTATSRFNFRVRKPISFTPTSGPIGTEITIIPGIGTGIDSDVPQYYSHRISIADKYIATYYSSSDPNRTSIKVKIPVGATTGKIIINSDGAEIVTSTDIFTVTP